jgi:signal transduction histidine kinase
MSKDSSKVLIISLFTVICTIFYYFGELVKWVGWDSLQNEFFNGVHDVHRLFFFLPIIYAAYTFRVKGAITVTLVSLVIFLPRALFISTYPDPILRMLIFVIFAGVLGYLVAKVFNGQDELKNLEAERKKMEEQLIMQDRMVSIGQLSSGMAHEINNPLTGVIALSTLLIQKELPDDIKEDLIIINEEAQRTARILKNLLVFARGQPDEKQPMNINECIQKILELHTFELKEKKIQVNVRLEPNLPPIFGSIVQLQQVFLNIIINAEFFMFELHGKGILTITTQKKGNYIQSSVSDDGPGISKENMKRLFTPFFTTKEVGNGTGLGLSICHGIITEHGGRIRAESDLGKGSTFYIEMPIYNGPV